MGHCRVDLTTWEQTVLRNWAKYERETTTNSYQVDSFAKMLEKLENKCCDFNKWEIAMIFQFLRDEITKNKREEVERFKRLEQKMIHN